MTSHNSWPRDSYKPSSFESKEEKNLNQHDSYIYKSMYENEKRIKISQIY